MLLHMIGDKYINTAFPNTTYTIVAISPKKDYENQISYFMEVNEAGQIWYDVEYEFRLNEWYEKI